MPFMISEYSASLTKKDFGPLFLLSLLLLEGPKTVTELVRIMKCCDKTLQRHLSALGALVCLNEFSGYVCHRTDLSAAAPINNNNNNHDSLTQSDNLSLQDNSRIEEPSHEVREPLAAGTTLSATSPALDESVRRNLYRRLAQHALPDVPGASIQELEHAIERVDRWFVHPKHKPYLDRMVTAAAKSTAVAAQSETIRGTGMQYFSGTLQTMAHTGRWQASRPTVHSAPLDQDHPASDLQVEEVPAIQHLAPRQAGASQVVQPSETLTAAALRELGVRLATPAHARLVAKWTREWLLSPELILKAVEHAALAGVTHFGYVDAILSDWHQLGVHTLDDAARVRTEFRRTRNAMGGDRTVDGQYGPVPSVSSYATANGSAKPQGRYARFVDRQIG